MRSARKFPVNRASSGKKAVGASKVWVVKPSLSFRGKKGRCVGSAGNFSAPWCTARKGPRKERKRSRIPTILSTPEDSNAVVGRALRLKSRGEEGRVSVEPG